MVLNSKTFESELKKFIIFEKNAVLAAGVSGGIDSIVLAILLSKWSKKNNYTLVALIVDHKIRVESSIEANNVSKYLSNLKIKNRIIKLKKNQKLNGIQKRSRYGRFKAFNDYCKKNNILHLFLGHNKNDNLEIYILRKVGGSGLEGLRSIRKLTRFKRLQIIRPLLNFQRKEIFNYAKQYKLNWVEDPSNLNLNFSRIKVRDLISKNVKLKNIIQKELEKFEKITDKYMEMINFNLALSIFKIEDSIITLDAKILLKMPKQISIKIISISMKYVNNSEFTNKYAKLAIIYSNILKKTSKFRSQNTIFKNEGEKIIISAIK